MKVACLILTHWNIWLVHYFRQAAAGGSEIKRCSEDKSETFVLKK